MVHSTIMFNLLQDGCRDQVRTVMVLNGPCWGAYPPFLAQASLAYRSRVRGARGGSSTSQLCQPLEPREGKPRQPHEAMRDY